jgi:uncharacterized protein YdhG (YjbR/CyaY superfamily)
MKPTVNTYITSQPEAVQVILQKIREIILAAHPEITEEIAYMMPAYKLNKKPLVYFAAFKKHIGFYATPTGHEAFKEALSSYKQGKGSVQFPLSQEIPFELIRDIVKFKVEENLVRK